MAQPTTQDIIVKAEIDGDMRRVNMVLPKDASPEQILQSIRTTVAQGFEIEEAVLPALKYKDDEGDLCTLVRGSVDDMLQMFDGHTLRLFATTAPAAGVSAVHVSKEQSWSHFGSPRVLEERSPEGVPFVPMEDAVAVDDDDKREWPDDDFGMDMQVGAIFRKQSDVSGGGQQDVAMPHDQDIQDLHGLAELTAMGFSIDQAQRAMEDAKGNVEMAVGYLAAGHYLAAAVPFVPMEDDAADDDGDDKEWPDTDFGMDMQVLETASIARTEAPSPHSVNGQPTDVDAIPCEQPEVLAADPVDRTSVDVCGAAELTAMGFSEKRAQQAMEDAHGNLEMAAAMLSSAACEDTNTLRDNMNATPLDNAQVLFSTSISKFRTQMSGLGNVPS